MNRAVDWARFGAAWPRALAIVLALLVSNRLVGVGPLAAADARQIIMEAQKRGSSQSQQYEGVLQSFSPNGKTSEKRWTFARLGAFGESKSVIRFISPAEVRGVALLALNHPDKASDQWMWTPALERDRRIALQDRSTRFFGTDFSFEDLEERDVDQYDYVLRPDQAIEKVPCWTIEETPHEAKSSQYTKAIVWVRKDILVAQRIESYVQDQVMRRLDYADFQKIEGIWTARQMKMTDLHRGGVTLLTLEKITYNAALSESDFTLQALRRQ